jgi:hypothetical protein
MTSLGAAGGRGAVGQLAAAAGWQHRCLQPRQTQAYKHGPYWPCHHQALHALAYKQVVSHSKAVCGCLPCLLYRCCSWCGQQVKARTPNSSSSSSWRSLAATYALGRPRACCCCGCLCWCSPPSTSAQWIARPPTAAAATGRGTRRWLPRCCSWGRATCTTRVSGGACPAPAQAACTIAYIVQLMWGCHVVIQA